MGFAPTLLECCRYSPLASVTVLLRNYYSETSNGHPALKLRGAPLLPIVSSAFPFRPTFRHFLTTKMFGAYTNTPSLPYVPGLSLPSPSALVRSPGTQSQSDQYGMGMMGSVSETGSQGSYAPPFQQNRPQPPSIFSRLAAAESSSKPTPIILSEIFSLLTEVHGNIVISLAKISDVLMRNHGWNIRELEPGHSLTFLIEQFIELTCALSYISQIDPVKKAIKLSKGLVADKEGKERARESLEYLEERFGLSQKVEACRKRMWKYLKDGDEAIGNIHYGLTEEHQKHPLLESLKSQHETLSQCLTAFSRIWLAEIPAKWNKVANGDFVSLRRNEQGWTKFGEKVEEEEKGMRREVEGLIWRMQRESWISRDRMAFMVQYLWDGFDYEKVEEELGWDLDDRR